jgi:hypothetical protein
MKSAILSASRVPWGGVLCFKHLGPEGASWWVMARPRSGEMAGVGDMALEEVAIGEWRGRCGIWRWREVASGEAGTWNTNSMAVFETRESCARAGSPRVAELTRDYSVFAGVKIRTSVWMKSLPLQRSGSPRTVEIA